MLTPVPDGNQGPLLPPDPPPPLGPAQPLAEPPALVLRGLWRRFGSTIAVAGLDLDVPTGSCYGLVGPNGAGKTTTLLMATGLLRPDFGSVWVQGVDLWADPLRGKALLGVLPDGIPLFDRLTGAQAITYAGLLRGLDRDTVAARTADLLRTMDLQRDADTLVVDYSAGMTKKIALACAMVHAPGCWCSTSRSRRSTRSRRPTSATSSPRTSRAAAR